MKRIAIDRSCRLFPVAWRMAATSKGCVPAVESGGGVAEVDGDAACEASSQEQNAVLAAGAWEFAVVQGGDGGVPVDDGGEAPEDATMTSVARINGTDIGEVGYSGASSRPAFLEPEIEEAAQDGGQMLDGNAATCAEMRACNAVFAEHAADFDEEIGRPLDFSDIEFLTVRSSTGMPEAACLSCQSVLVRREATGLSAGG